MMKNIQYEAGETITTYVYRKDNPEEVWGKYGYNTSRVMINLVIIIIVAVALGYWIKKKRRK